MKQNHNSRARAAVESEYHTVCIVLGGPVLASLFKRF